MKEIDAQDPETEFLILEVGIKPKHGVLKMLAEKLLQYKNS